MFFTLLPCRLAHLTRLICLLCALLVVASPAQSAPDNAEDRQNPKGMSVRFLDSATGAEIQPGELVIRGNNPASRLDRDTLSQASKGKVVLGAGAHILAAAADGYQPASGLFEITTNKQYKIRFILDPIEEPLETRPEEIEKLRRPGYMLVQGFVVADEAGELLPGVTVTAQSSGLTARTDRRGFFRMQLPAAETPTATTLVLNKPGFVSQILKRVGLWSTGDVTYRLRLQGGEGAVVVDETANDGQDATGTGSATTNLPAAGTEPALLPAPSDVAEPAPQEGTLPANATVRVPRSIRVLNGDGTTIDVVSLTYYTRAVLGSEWIASWGGYIGGSNSLSAGAVAIRCYAISRINNASATSSYDICGTSSCQVYNPTKIHAYSDTAVYYTADWVVVSGGAIAGTEYSAENNSLDLDGVSTFSCPDGFTAPTGGCLYDPVCAGQDRFGHGRGMCQWGTARWATGRRMHLRSSGDATPNGYPRRDWKWIVQHYYPQLSLVKGASLIMGDDVKALRTVDVRACPGGEITNGTACALVTTKTSGNTGVILGGPVTVSGNDKGFTWYKIQWNDANSTIGWTVENHLDRVFSAPTAPTTLTSVAGSGTRIDLTWADTSNVEAGFRLERAPAAAGPWMPLVTLNANTISYADTGLLPGNTWHYRVNAYNAAGLTAFSSTASAATALPPPVIGSISAATILEEQPLTQTATALPIEKATLLANFDAFMSETANGTVLFKTPRFSSSTSALLETLPDVGAVTDAFPAGLGTGRVLRAQFAFANTANAWLRLTTAGTTYFPNPVIPLGGKLRFNIYSDKPIRVAIGCRETSSAAGTAVGANGGTTGAIEWVGVTNVTGTAPAATRVIPAGSWTTLTFDLPAEPARSFSAGNGILSSASGLGVLEHLAIVPGAGAGVYNIYLDDFTVVSPRSFTWSLGPGTPAGATIHPVSGAINWTPTEAQGPGEYALPVIAADSSVPTLRATNSWNVTVNEQNRAPEIASLPAMVFTVYAGSTLQLTNAATDPDLPPNMLTFSLDPGAPPSAGINPATGLFTWTTTGADAPGSQAITVRVTDNGIPVLGDTETFAVEVKPPPALTLTSVSPGQFALGFETLPGTAYSIQYKDDLTAPEWSLLTNFTASSTQVTVTNEPGLNQRFYRILVSRVGG